MIGLHGGKTQEILAAAREFLTFDIVGTVGSRNHRRPASADQAISDIAEGREDFDFLVLALSED